VQISDFIYVVGAVTWSRPTRRVLDALALSATRRRNALSMPTIVE
jgi:hypothetical protein